MTEFLHQGSAVPTTEAVLPHEQLGVPVVQPPQEKQEAPRGEAEAEVPESEEANVTPEPEKPRSMARVEYRDQDGNVLDEKMVASMAKEGKVSFETRHETRTRLANGHEMEMVDGRVAPPHPDVEGQNPETQGKQEAQAEESPASAAGKGSSVEEQNSPEPKPASEGQEATQL